MLVQLRRVVAMGPVGSFSCVDINWSTLALALSGRGIADWSLRKWLVSLPMVSAKENFRPC